MIRIYPREEYCTGCRLCEIHCIVEHSESRDIVKAFKREQRPQKRVEVEESGHVSFALQCRHCEEAPESSQPAVIELMGARHISVPST